MQNNFKAKEYQSDENNGKFLISLNDLMDDMEFENNQFSEMYQERGEIYDKEKSMWGVKTNSAGRYTSKFIHYIMKNEHLDKFKPSNKNNKEKKKNANGK